jgi:serine/threonine-protein kinase
VTRSESHALAPASGEEARAFLQGRLAFLGLAYCVIGVAFYAVANLIASRLPQHSWVHFTSKPVLLANATYLLQWLLCRRGRRSEAALRVIDGTSAILAAGCSAFLVFTSFPGEIQGLSYSRALLLFTFGLVLRAIVVPSSARRTLVLGLLASAFPVTTSHIWSAHVHTTIPRALASIFTANWCLGGVVISTLASRAIFGLRQQVREASQLGQYTLLEKIGEGGMGAVYRASHAMLRRPTAIKLLLPEKAGTNQIERFEREVQLTGRLTHPNTISVFDYGRTPDGVFYYAMEYLEGLNLQDLVRFDGPQPPGRVVHILRQVAGSLAEAHGIGLIHRDIKPANVILVAERGGAPDVVKVVDFGLVKDLHQNAQLTQDQLVGTPHFLSPEAIRSPEDVEARSDLYSLGCVAYFLLTGQTVFEGRTLVEVATHLLNTRPIPPSRRLGGPVPETLSALILSCLEKEPDRRPRSAEAFLAALDACRDVPPWTGEHARAWWSTEGMTIMARVRLPIDRGDAGEDPTAASGRPLIRHAPK